MPTRADIETATPKCTKGEVANVPGAMCGGLLRWRLSATRDGVWLWTCPAHGIQMSGLEAAQRAGYVMEIVEAA